MSTLGSSRLLEGLGGIRDVLLMEHSRLLHIYRRRSLIPASRRRKHFHRSEPRYVMEAFGWSRSRARPSRSAIARGVYPPASSAGALASVQTPDACRTTGVCRWATMAGCHAFCPIPSSCLINPFPQMLQPRRANAAA